MMERDVGLEPINRTVWKTGGQTRWPIPLMLTILLSGCATAPALPKTVLVPVPTPCVAAADVPAVPTLTDEAAILAMSDYGATLTVYAERLALRSYAARADAIIQGCR